MSTNHDEQQAGPDVQKPEGIRIEASRRQFLQFSAAAAGGLAFSAAFAEDSPVMAERSNRPSWAPTKYLIDCHVHLGTGPTIAELAPSIHGPQDWSALRTKQPEKFAKAMSESAVESEQIAWKTANQIYKLGLKG